MKTRCYDGKKWQYEFKHEGKRYRKKGFRTKREANSAGLDKLNELRQGFNFENNLTFEDYFKNWIETYKENIVSENTFRHYRFTLKHIQRHKIGKVEISKINKQMYQKFINDFSENRAKEIIRKTNGAIKSALEDAVYDGLIAKNPTYKITFKAGKTTKSEEEKYISLEEYKALKEYLKDKSSKSALALYIMICTGCRVSGVRSMKLEYINEFRNELYIDEHKTDSSPRYVAVGKNDLRHIINVIKNSTISYDGYIFKDGGKLISINAINKTLKKACESLGIKYITSHALRHTHCSYLLAKDISIYYISKRLGHKNISITTSIYSHLLEEKFSEEEQKTKNILDAM
ncbi:site-specific integrase [Staphylococcus pseudintermedius]|nr:site-specific integrase [Staphylococcus pseudintermedius]